MKNVRASFFKSLLPLVALGAFFAIAPAAGCKDPVGNGGGDLPCMSDADCDPNQICTPNGVCSGSNAQVEVCNGIDDDGDGVVDNEGMTPLCANGAVCVNGQCGGQPPPCGPNGGCPPGQVCDAAGMCVPDGSCMASPEVCDGIDNDCDGAIDNPSDPAVSLCQNGAQCVNGSCGNVPPPCMADADCPMGLVCTNGVCTQGGCVPGPEVCDGVDNDCDGAVDNQSAGGIPLCPNGGMCVNGGCGNVPPPCMSDADCPMGQVCNPNGVCSNVLPPLCMSNADCPAGQICTPNGVCSPGGCVPGPEVCDGVDNNCDGVVDNQSDPNAPLCPNGGMCVNGQCGNGMCVPAPEICDGIDNDCDGITDEKTPGAILCPQGKLCFNGMCSIKQCNSNMDCPAGSACLNGLCQ